MSEILGIAANNFTLKFAVFHTLFNMVGVMIMLPLLNVLVIFLEKVLREKVEPVEVTRVLFLNNSALEFPDTALEVLTKETIHLAHNAFEILAHGLNLHREDITSDEELEHIIERSSKTMEINIDDYYQRKVKPLYNAIIEYGSRAEQAMEAGQLDQLNHLKIANFRIVNAIKAMKEMQRNLDRFASVDNKYLQRAYNTIRLRTARVLRILFHMETEISDEQRLADLKDLKFLIEQEHSIADGTLVKLIREHRVTSDMATSLMNDDAFAYDIQHNLVAAAEVVLAEIISLEQDTELSEEELDQQVLAKHEETLSRLKEEEAKIDALSRSET